MHLLKLRLKEKNILFFVFFVSFLVKKHIFGRIQDSLLHQTVSFPFFFYLNFSILGDPSNPRHPRSNKDNI